MARSAARAPCAIRSSARWKSNQPIWPTRGEIRKVGRIAGKPGAGDAILHDVEGVDHDGRDARPRGAAEKLPFHGALGREQFAEAARGRGGVEHLGHGRDRDSGDWPCE